MDWLPPDETTHSASEVPSKRRAPCAMSQQIGFCVVVDMVTAKAESSVFPTWKLLRSSVADIQIV